MTTHATSAHTPLPPISPHTDGVEPPAPEQTGHQGLPPASVIYDLLNQMLWKTGTYHHSPRGYSRLLAENPYEVLRGYGNRFPAKNPPQTTFTVATQLTSPQCGTMRLNRNTAPAASSMKDSTQLRYPYGNPVLPRMPSRNHPFGGNTPPLVGPVEHSGHQLKTDEMLHVSSCVSSVRAPKAELAPKVTESGVASVLGGCDMIRIPNCSDEGPPNTPLGPQSVGLAPEMGGCQTEDTGQPAGASKTEASTVIRAVLSPDHVVVDAHLDGAHLLVPNQEGEAIYQVSNGEPATNAGVTRPDDQQTVTSCYQQTLSISGTGHTLSDINQTPELSTQY